MIKQIGENMAQYPEFEQWQTEGLFERTQYHNKNYTVSRKKKALRQLRSEFFDRVQNSNAGASKTGGLPFIHLDAEIKDWVINKTRHIYSDKMRAAFIVMVFGSLDLPSSWNVSQKHGYRYPQFVIDFNLAIHNIIRYEGM